MIGTNWTNAKDLQQTNIEIATAEAGDALNTGPSKIGAGGSDVQCRSAVKRPCITNLGDIMSFKSVEKKISSKEGVGMKRAGAILASASRNASPAAKRANPNLNKVKGK